MVGGLARSAVINKFCKENTSIFDINNIIKEKLI